MTLPPATSGQPARQAAAKPPLYVDLDGTLTPADTLKEAALLLVRRKPWYLLLMLAWLWRGRGAFKRRVASVVVPDAAALPWHQGFLQYLREQRLGGRTLVLATASDERVAAAMATHLGLFSHVLATRTENLRGAAKLRAIQAHAGGPFAYAGNSADDLAVWGHCEEAVAVGPSALVRRRLLRLHPQALMFERGGDARWPLLKALRLHQWAKNLLIFLPLLTGHVRDLHGWLLAAIAFVAFGLCASSAYLLNDLFDLESDRAHPVKHRRPLAAGQLDLGTGAALAAVLGIGGLAVAASVSASLLLLLAGYIVLTAAYTTRLKAIAVVDVLVLAVLYAGRVLAGAVVAGVSLSNWLMAFALFLFLSLALLKRCAELRGLERGSGRPVPGRGYTGDDLPVLRAMGVASGFAAVLVLALYIDSQNGKALYPSPTWLWGLAPLQLAWTMRIWLKVARGELLGEDPVSFVLTDRYSWLTLAAMVLCVAAAARMLPCA